MSPVEIVVFSASVIMATLRALRSWSPDPEVVMAVIRVLLSVSLRLVLLPMPVMFVIWAIVWRTHGDMVTKIGPHMAG
jgi:hypothetical protein